MNYLNEFMSIKSRANATIQLNNQYSSVARNIRRDTDILINNQINGTSTITTTDYNKLSYRQKSVECQQAYAIPKTTGTYYDLTIYNDGSDDYYPYVFGKTLDHNATSGFVKKSDIDPLIEAVKMNTQDLLALIPRHANAVRKLEGVPVANALNNEGKQPHAIDLTVHAIDSGEMMFEMMEVYAMRLLRDTPFADWDGDDTVATVVSELNKYASDITAPVIGTTITTQTLLRGNHSHETIGPYISQFLLHPFHYGNLPMTQKYYLENDAHSMLSMAGWLGVQQGVTGDTLSDISGTLKYIYSPRMLGSIVHRDPFFQFYYNAALILNTYGVGTVGYDNSDVNSSVWSDGGSPAALSALAEVSAGALHTAWRMKYGLTLRIRPEVLAQRITVANNNATLRANVDKLNTIKTNADIGSGILSLVNSLNISNGGEVLGGQNYYLDVLFQEGSPTHPSCPAGHALVAGACTTVLKAMVATHDSEGVRIPWVSGSRLAYIADASGDSLNVYSGEDVSSMTIVGELNKLASNISLGRDFAGVHYREDGTKGMLAGEEYAISFLQDKIKEYGAQANGMFGGFDLEKFDGTRILIKADSISSLS